MRQRSAVRSCSMTYNVQQQTIEFWYELLIFESTTCRCESNPFEIRHRDKFRPSLLRVRLSERLQTFENLVACVQNCRTVEIGCSRCSGRGGVRDFVRSCITQRHLQQRNVECVRSNLRHFRT